MFEVRKGKKKYNQAHYEALGEVTRFVEIIEIYHNYY